MKIYSAEEKEILIERWKASGKSRCAFAKEQGIALQTFCRWTINKKETSGFVELKKKLKWPEQNNRELILEHGETRIRIPLEITELEIKHVAALWRALV